MTYTKKNVQPQCSAAIFNSIADAVFTVDRDFVITSFNTSAEKITGWSKEEVVGQQCMNIFKSSVCGTDCILGQCVLFEKNIVNQDIFITKKNGETLSVSISASPLVDDDGNIVGGVETIRDNSLNLKNELVLSSVADGVFSVNNDFEIVSFNRAAEELTGWKEEDALGKQCRDVFKSSVCGSECVLGRCIANSITEKDKEIYITHKSGKTIPVVISASPLFCLSGKVIGGVETVRDNTLSLRNDLVLDSVADGVFLVDEEFLITSFNHAASLMTGWQGREVIGKPCKDIFQSSICGNDCILGKCVQTGESLVDQDIFIKNKDGELMSVSISASPLLDADGKVIGGVETFRDNSLNLRSDLVVDSVADGVFSVDRDWKITSFNRAAERITGWNVNDAVGSYCGDVFKSSICGKNCAIAESMYGGKPVVGRNISIENIDGGKIPVSVSASPLVDHDGNIIGGVETFRDLNVENELRKELKKSYSFDEMISKSAAMQRMFRILPEIARSDSTVLVLGESGTGKELIAKAIFNNSNRSDKPFVVLNCAALPETLLESELFGHKAGAFTDAKKDRKGRFAAAEGGTIFLDEIGDIPPALQVKLLRVLQQKVYEPLGSDESVKANVRIITATNKDLEKAVADGSFREDLFYRLNVVKISLPPLRDRMEDLPLLIDHFVKKFAILKSKDIHGLTDEALVALMGYKFPGNIRELENIIEYGFILCDEGYVKLRHLPEPFATESNGGGEMLAGKTLADVEKFAILSSLEKNKWKRMKTCRELGISKDTLRRKIKTYGLEQEK